MKWIGLTGGIACGKSTVAKMLRSANIPVIDADEIAREVVSPNSSGLKSIVTHFGPGFILPDGNLDRAKMAQQVFGKPEQLKKLESILHPLIRSETQTRRDLLKKSGAPLAIYDIPLLFETHAQDQFDQIIVVSCTVEQQKERLRLRQQWSEEEIQNRLASQIPVEIKAEEADFVVQNNRDQAHLQEEIARLLEWLR